ncbi:hypothetical protein Dalk_4216 [Desulfatibacillum aliphaticivorans]|uniref:Uncharacterized protein n=2 Tax=Desulfatibacillum aliphaticivorans TaxID=218208 RepID=B8FN28_DESAL|nr:hypothetical protein Dalk_4216 [Desulfatibacillum aliphaticivorans]
MLPILFGSRRKASGLCLIMAAFFCLIFSAGCGTEGKGNDDGVIPSYDGSAGTGSSGGSSGGSSSGGSVNDNTASDGEANNLILKSSRITTNSAGTNIVMGEVQYTGKDVAYDCAVKGRFYDANGAMIFVNGARIYSQRPLVLASSGYSQYCLATGETGYFMIGFGGALEDLDRYEIAPRCLVSEIGEEVKNPENEIKFNTENTFELTALEFYGQEYYDYLVILDRVPDYFPMYAIELDYTNKGDDSIYDAYVQVAWFVDGELYDIDKVDLFQGVREVTANVSFAQTIYSYLNAGNIDHVLMPFWHERAPISKKAGESEAYEDASGADAIAGDNAISNTYVHYVDQDQWFRINEFGWEEPYFFPPKDSKAKR